MYCLACVSLERSCSNHISARFLFWGVYSATPPPIVCVSVSYQVGAAPVTNLGRSDVVVVVVVVVCVCVCVVSVALTPQAKLSLKGKREIAPTPAPHTVGKVGSTLGQ
jgi:hypothetical protein